MDISKYFLLSMWILLLANKEKSQHTKLFFLTIFLTCLLILTRSIGLALFLALIISNQFLIFPNKSNYLSRTSILLLAFFPLYIWIFHSAGLSGGYHGAAIWLLNTPDPLHTLYIVFKTNMYAFLDAWIQLTIIFNSEDNYIATLLSYLFLTLSSIGLFIRRKSVDGIYILIYLSVISIWPYPYDMTRFIYPVFPLLLIYGVVGYLGIFHQVKPARNSYYLVGLIYLAIALPSLNFIYQRHMLGKSINGYDISQIPTLYEKNAGHAFLKSIESMQIVEYFEKLGDLLEPGEHVISLKPEMVTYLSDLRAEQLPTIVSRSHASTFIADILALNSDYILLTNIVFPSHPMGIDVLDFPSPYTEIVSKNYSKVTGEPSIILLRIKD